jgi:hypothetical protein
MVRMIIGKMKRKKGQNRRRFRIMKSILMVFLIGGSVLSVVFSCATVPKEPLPSGEVRLLGIDVVGAGVEANSSFAVNIFFEAAGKPEIKRACFYDSGEGPYCFDVTYATLGTKRALQVYLPGINEYLRDGVTRKTNVVFIQIIAGTHS